MFKIHICSYDVRIHYMVYLSGYIRQIMSTYIITNTICPQVIFYGLLILVDAIYSQDGLYLSINYS